MRALDVEPNLPDTGADARHRLPVVRIEALLDASKLKPSDPSDDRRETPEVGPRRSDPHEWLLTHTWTASI
jgi:hypothetical protein